VKNSKGAYSDDEFVTNSANRSRQRFHRGKVTLSIQRGGATNIEHVIKRSSWNILRGLSYNPYE
jgi:hypothetical protein